MGDFNRGGNRGGGGGFRGGSDRGGRPSFQKRSFGGDRGGDRERAEMHKATCSECSKICEVPFRPSNDKPVYCNDCFSSKREGVDRKPRGDFGDRAPRREFDRPAQRPEISRAQPANDEMKNQLRDLNSKMDRLVTLMEKMTNSSAKQTTAPVTAKPAEIKKVVVASKPVAKVVAKKVVTKAKVAKVAAKKVVAKKKK